MRSVVVTGSSSGIGRATALHLDELGYGVFATVRSDADAEALREAGSQRLSTALMDVTDAGSIARVARQVEEAVGAAGLHGLVNNAGTVKPGPLELLPVDELRGQLEVNLIGQVAVTQALLPALRRARGRIVLVSSVGGRIGLPFTGAYHASKWALEGAGESLRQELRPWGIEVILIEPGSIATPFWGKGVGEGESLLESLPPESRDLYDERIRDYQMVVRKTAERGIQPREVATAIARALGASRPRTRYLVGRDAKLQGTLRRFIPDRWFDRLVEREMRP